MGFGRNLALADIHTSKRPANIILESSGLFRIFAENCHFDKKIFFLIFSKGWVYSQSTKELEIFLEIEIALMKPHFKVQFPTSGSRR